MKKTLIKICGMTNIDDIECVNDIDGIDYIGIILVDTSPRCVTYDVAKKLINACNKDKKIVTVFMNQSEEYIAAAINNLNPDILQFHGNESLEFCNKFKKPFIKTFHVENDSLSIDKDFMKHAHALLLDTSIGDLRGGTGKIFDWTILNKNKLIEEISLSLPCFVAGGLNPSNIKDLISNYNPSGIDVSSGLESSIGKKDHLLMKKLIENVRISQLDYYEKS